MNTWQLEHKRLARSAVGFMVLSAFALFLFSGATGTRRTLAYSVRAELLLLAVPFACWLLIRANAWTKRHDVLSPLLGLPIAYVLWFSLGSIDWIEVPSTWLFGLFEPIPSRMWFYYALGLVGLLIGALLCRPYRLVEEVSPVAWDQARSRAVLIGLFAMMILSWVILVLQFGIPGRSSNASEARLLVHGPFYFSFVASGWTFFLFLPLRNWIARRDKPRPAVTIALLIFTAVLLASLAGRSNIFVPLLTLLIVRHYTVRRFTLRSAVVIGLCAFLGLSLFGYLRDTAESDRSLLWMQTAGIPEPLVPAATAAVYVRYSIATFRDVTEMMPVHVPYQYGALTFAPFKTFLPGRQEMSDIFFRDLLGNDFVGAGEPATLLGPLYGDFGAPGVFLGMLAFGLLLAYLYRRMQSKRDPYRILAYAWVLQSGLFGLFATIFPYITTVLLPLFWFGLHRYLRKPEMTPANG